MNYNVVITRIAPMGEQESLRYRVYFDKAIPAYVRKQVDDGEYDYELGEANYIDFVPSVLLAQMINFVPDLGAIHSAIVEQSIRNGESRHGLDAATLGIYLAKAKLELVRDEFAEGDEYEDAAGETRTHAHAGFNTAIAGVEITEKAQSRIDARIDKMLGL